MASCMIDYGAAQAVTCSLTSLDKMVQLTRTKCRPLHCTWGATGVVWCGRLCTVATSATVKQLQLLDIIDGEHGVLATPLL